MEPIDKILALKYTELPEQERTCYQPTDNSEGALTIDGYGSFAPAPYGEKDWNTIKKASSTWRYRICHATGIDQDHDSGIYDVDRDYWNESAFPSHCILKDGSVIGFVHSPGCYFIIGSITSHCDDFSSGSIVDRTTYWLVKAE